MKIFYIFSQDCCIIGLGDNQLDIFGKLTINKLQKRSKQFNTKVKMETTTSFPYSIVRFCTMNEVQVMTIIAKTIIWNCQAPLSLWGPKQKHKE